MSPDTPQPQGDVLALMQAIGGALLPFADQTYMTPERTQAVVAAVEPFIALARSDGAKAQREADVEWLTPALSGAPAYRDLLRALAARPLISEEGATRGD